MRSMLCGDFPLEPQEVTMNHKCALQIVSVRERFYPVSVAFVPSDADTTQVMTDALRDAELLSEANSAVASPHFSLSEMHFDHEATACRKIGYTARKNLPSSPTRRNSGSFPLTGSRC